MSEDIYHKVVKDDIEHFVENDIYVPTRTIYMGSTNEEDGVESGVNYAMAERVIKTLHILDTWDASARKGEKPITIIMNNPGGDVVHGMGIYDAIKNCTNHVTIKVYGHAMSMGSVILQAADRRIMSKNSNIMIHYGYGGSFNHIKTTYKWNEWSQKTDRWMEELFLEKIGDKKITVEEFYCLINKPWKIPKGNAKNKLINIHLDELEKMLDFDTIIDADMALKLNLIDEIIE